MLQPKMVKFFFFAATPSSPMYALSLHDALPILPKGLMVAVAPLNSSTPPLLPPGCSESKLTPVNSILHLIASAVDDLKKIWLLGTSLPVLPLLRISLLVETLIPPLNSTVLQYIL